MYVAELDRPWLESPFLFQGFLLTSEKDLARIRDLCQFVYVDEEQSTVLPPAEAAKEGAPSSAAASEPARAAVSGPYQKPVEEELPAAAQVRARVATEINKFFTASRLGDEIDPSEAKSMVEDITSSIERNPDALILLSSLKGQNEAMSEHAFATSVVSLHFGRHLGLDAGTVRDLGMAALLHDIGETKIPPEVLERPNRDRDEIYRKHPEFGAELLKATPGIPKSVVQVALDHEEHVDGTGFPRGLSGDKLSLLTKVVSIANVYDELVSGLLGKRLTGTDALRSMYKLRGKFFDAELFEHFITCIGIYPVGCIVELKRGDVGLVISIPPDSRRYPRLLIVRDQNKRRVDPPRIMNLASFAKTSLAHQYLIAKVLPVGVYDIDPAAYVLREIGG